MAHRAGPGRALLRAPLLLALHHVNSRDACIVGNETLSRIPENFKISFKMKNSDFIPTGAAEALTTWTYMHRFLNDACRLLIPANLTVSSKAGITTEVLDAFHFSLDLQQEGVPDKEMEQRCTQFKKLFKHPLVGTL